MDVERFATELPELFDDFPRSETPRGRRFDDIIDGIPNLATENVLALLNLAASCLGPDESYVEVGSFYGASLIGAMRGNTGDFVAIDRFSFDVPEVRGRPLPQARASEYLRRCAIYFTTEAEERNLPYVLEWVGDDRVMISGDMPHSEARDDAVEEIEARTDLTADQKQRLLRDNAARFYGF